MKRNLKQDNRQTVFVGEKDLRWAAGGAETAQHVDNPGQTPMKDGNP